MTNRQYLISMASMDGMFWTYVDTMLTQYFRLMIEATVLATYFQEEATCIGFQSSESIISANNHGWIFFHLGAL
jgi:uncharacterized membrane protein